MTAQIKLLKVLNHDVVQQQQQPQRLISQFFGVGYMNLFLPFISIKGHLPSNMKYIS